MKKLFIALLAALLLAFAACAAPQQETAAPEPAQSEPASAVSWDDLTFDRTLPLQYATQFSVSFAGEDYTRLTIGDDQTFLVVAGDAPVPDGVPADVTVLTRPLSHIYLVATAAMDYFRQLDAIDAIALSGQKEADWYIDEAKAAMQAGTMVYAGKYSAPDYETILAAGCDLAIENTMIYHTPVVSIFIGEGGSGGALALACGDEVWMMENAVYSVLSPEGFASILWKDKKCAPEAADKMKLTAEDVVAAQAAERMIKEPEKLTTQNMGSVLEQLREELRRFLKQYAVLEPEKLCDRRYERFRKL